MMTAELKPTEADNSIDQCLKEGKSFSVIAGAGSGKTTSLIRTLENIRDFKGANLRKNGQKVVCLTFTKRAVEVIRKRLQWDELFVVSTLHSFLWGEICRFSKDIGEVLYSDVIPGYITHILKDDDGKSTKKATTAREKAGRLQTHRDAVLKTQTFRYEDGPYSDYEQGELGHEDVIKIASALIKSRELLRRVIGQRYPYIFIDEAQDTHEEIVSALNAICDNTGLPIIGYFGDPMQQIYDKRAGTFEGPHGSVIIPKRENFRCSVNVIKLLNAFRGDLEQFPAGDNSNIQGSVIIRFISTEAPELPRNRYSPDQIIRATKSLDNAVSDWGWDQPEEVKHLYLVRQMIARRIGFISLHNLFDGEFASQKAKDDFETGEFFLLKPFIKILYPLIIAFREGDTRKQVDILRRLAPAFDPKGKNSKRTLAAMMEIAFQCTSELNEIWNNGTVGDVLRFSLENELVKETERLLKHINRAKRSETYNEEEHGLERQDWLADQFFRFSLSEVERYCEFITENTVYSTQHGVKGEEYNKVLVVFDDIGSGWNQYNFSGLLTPKTHEKRKKSTATERQLRLSKNLAYVCFSRAMVDLRIVFFTPDASAAALELEDSGLFLKEQIEVQD